MIVEDYQPQGRAIAETAPGHQVELVLMRRLALFATGLVVVIIVVLATLSLVMNGLSREEKRQRRLTPPRFVDGSELPPGPALQPRPMVELTRLKETQEHRLNNYGWVDRDKGIAHIPIERAIDILTRTGLPRRPAPKTKEADKKALEKKS
jgi:hypothetical protein